MERGTSVSDNWAVLKLLRKINRFDEFSDQDLAAVLKVGKLRQYEPGEVVIREGEFDCWVYIMITGTLEVVKSDTVVSVLRRNGDLFGEMGVIDGVARSATVRAGDKSLVLGFDGSVIDRKMKTKEMNFCYVVYRLFSEVLAARLRNATVENTNLRKELDELRETNTRLAAENERLKKIDDGPATLKRVKDLLAASKLALQTAANDSAPTGEKGSG